MRPDFIDFIQNAGHRKVGKFRTQLITFFVCLVFSVIFWFFVRLSKEYFYTIDYQLNYTHIPENYRLVSYSSNTLTLKMKVQGLDFFSERYFKPREKFIDVNLKGIKMKPDGRYLVAMLPTQTIGKEISFQANLMHDVHSIDPDTIFLEFDRIPLKKIFSPKSLNEQGKAKTQLYDTIFFPHDSLIKKRLEMEMKNIAKEKPPTKKKK